MEKPFKNCEESLKKAYQERWLSFLANPPFSLEEQVEEKEDVFQRKFDLIRAVDCLETFKEEPFSVEQIVMVGNQVSESNPYISRGYRTRGNLLEETKTPIADGDEIPRLMEQLVFNYHHTWKELDPFERETHFFMDMIRIHPFEDGNRRTAFLFMDSHLMQQGYAPVYLTGNIYSQYLECIKENKIQCLTEIFREQSRKEAEIVMKLYKEIQTKKV